MRTSVAVVALFALIATGCGQMSRVKANFSGMSRQCVEGVSYLQFPSGVTVEYVPDGNIKTCK
jgi:hypothetical protein